MADTVHSVPAALFGGAFRRAWLVRHGDAWNCRQTCILQAVSLSGRAFSLFLRWTRSILILKGKNQKESCFVFLTPQIGTTVTGSSQKALATSTVLRFAFGGECLRRAHFRLNGQTKANGLADRVSSLISCYDGHHPWICLKRWNIDDSIFFANISYVLDALIKKRWLQRLWDG